VWGFFCACAHTYMHTPLRPLCLLAPTLLLDPTQPHQVLDRIIGFFTRSPPLLRPKPMAVEVAADGGGGRRGHPHAAGVRLQRAAGSGREGQRLVKTTTTAGTEGKENRQPAAQRREGARRRRGRGVGFCGESGAAAAAAAGGGGRNPGPRKSGGGGAPLAVATVTAAEGSGGRKRARTTEAATAASTAAAAMAMVDAGALAAAGRVVGLTCEERFDGAVLEGRMAAAAAAVADEGAVMALFVLPDGVEAAAAAGGGGPPPRRTARRGAGRRGWRGEQEGEEGGECGISRSGGQLLVCLPLVLGARCGGACVWAGRG
jgi:hypothetical protein